MPRGGNRPGAGRPVGTSVLSAIERLIVAAECSHRWRKDADDRLEAEMDAYYSRSDYLTATARVRLSIRKGRADQDALDDVEFSRREMSGMDAEDANDAPRIVSFAVGRKRGMRKAIEADVAKWASMRFGKLITPRMVKTVWANFRTMFD